MATAELKNTLTGTTVEDAKEQYRATRDPKEPLFARRTLVHFAVDQDLVFVTTRPTGKRTRFLPFNTGDGGAGRRGGAGNPRVPAIGDYRTAYLWEEIWAPDTWPDLLKRFLHVGDEDVRKGRGRKASPGKAHRLPMIFPRYHQWYARLRGEGASRAVRLLPGRRLLAHLECRYDQVLSSAALRRDEVAMRQMTELLADTGASLDERDVLTLELRREICGLLVKTGDHERARAGLHALLPDMAAVFGADHPETLHIQILLENRDRLAR
ncbi:hypothetical protein [Streptosporangium sp. NPDC023615]|uniref:hypothetical protein n=1 Tax=Streptosporangium sp. NPDC023615 TaxID=3154794 RepID=UPI00343A9189